MEWIPIIEAAARLGVSDRTIRRKIHAGELFHVKQGGRVLVKLDGESPTETLSAAGRQLSEVATASAVLRSQDQESMSAMLAAMTDTVGALRSDLWAARVGTGVSWLACVAILGLLGWGASIHHVSTVESEVSRVRFAYERDQLAATVEAQGSTVRAANQRVGVLEAQIAEDAKAHAATVGGLRQALTLLDSEREDLRTEVAELACRD